MSEIDQRPARRYGAAAAATVAGIVAAAVVILWSWNAVAAELFAAPTITFRHAIAIELGLAIVGATIGLFSRLVGGGRQTRASA